MNRREFLLRGTAAGTASVFPTARGAPATGNTAFRAGYAERDITPEIGMEQPGGYGKSFHKRLHDPCKVRTAVFDDGVRRVALVGVDALALPRRLVLDARKEIQSRCGIAPDSVLVGASHSHSSGPVGMVQPGEYDHASPLVRQLAYEKSSMAHAGYMKRLQAQLVEAVCAADGSRAEARCSFGSGVEEKVAYNRRFRMKNGLAYTHPGKGNPDIVEPAGPIDPEVGVIGTWDKNGRLVGCIVNYACHATTNPGGISANWVYYMEQVIRGAMKSDAVVVFLQGDCGDVTQVDNLDPRANPAPEQWARMVGGRIGAEAVKVLLSAEPGSSIRLDTRSTVWRVKRRVPSPKRLQRSLATVRKDPKEVGITTWTFAKEIVMLDALLAKEKDVEVEVQAVQVGPAVFVSNPAEYFCQFGLDMKARSPFPFTYPVELANGCVGYVPTEEALGPRGGGYETRLTSYSNLEATAGTQIFAEGMKLIGRLTPGTVPDRPKAPDFKEPWSYGNVPPELS